MRSPRSAYFDKRQEIATLCRNITQVTRDSYAQRIESCFGADSYRGSFEEYEEVFDYAYDILHAKKRHLEEYYDDPLRGALPEALGGGPRAHGLSREAARSPRRDGRGILLVLSSEYERVERLDEAKDVQGLRSDLGKDFLQLERHDDLEDEFDDLVIDWSSWRIGLDIGGFEAWVFVHYQDSWTYDVNIVGEYDAEANQDGAYSRLMAPADNLLNASPAASVSGGGHPAPSREGVGTLRTLKRVARKR